MGKIRNFSKVVRNVKNWPTFLLNFWSRKKGIQKYILRNGVQLLIREGTDDRYIFNEMAVHHIYNPPGFEITNTDTVIDIGGHIGTFAITSAYKASQGKIIACEPHPANHTLLKKNASLNQVHHLFIENKAVSDTQGTLSFFSDVTERSGRHSLIKSATTVKEFKVETITLSELVKKYSLSSIDFLKMDCEGAEYDILFHCPPKILARIKKIALEHHYVNKEKNVHTLKAFLEKKGFKVYIPTKHTELLFAKRV